MFHFHPFLLFYIHLRSSVQIMSPFPPSFCKSPASYSVNQGSRTEQRCSQHPLRQLTCPPISYAMKGVGSLIAKLLTEKASWLRRWWRGGFSREGVRGGRQRLHRCAACSRGRRWQYGINSRRHPGTETTDAPVQRRCVLLCSFPQKALGVLM